MIAATASSTSAALSRFAASSAQNALSKSASAVRNILATSACRQTQAARRIDRGPEALDPPADFFRPRLQRRTVDDEPRADIGDVLDLDEPISLQGCAGLHQIDDMAAQPEQRRQL